MRVQCSSGTPLEAAVDAHAQCSSRTPLVMLAVGDDSGGLGWRRWRFDAELEKVTHVIHGRVA